MMNANDRRFPNNAQMELCIIKRDVSPKVTSSGKLRCCKRGIRICIVSLNEGRHYTVMTER